MIRHCIEDAAALALVGLAASTLIVLVQLWT